MSQVRKYQTGGITPEKKEEEVVVTQEPVKAIVPGLEEIVLKENTKPETGVTTQKPTSYVILNGKKYENNEELRDWINEYFATVADSNGGDEIFNQISDLINKASTTGESVSYKKPGSEFAYIGLDGKGQYIDWEHLNDREDNRLQKRRSWLGKFLDSATNNRVQKSAESLQKMNGLQSFIEAKLANKTQVVDPNLINIGYGSGFFDYLKDPETKQFIKDENGNLKYDKNSVANQKAMQILSRIKRYLELTTDDERKQFHLDDAWTKKGAWDSLKGIYDSDPEAFNANYDNIINKIVTGQKLSAEDISWLKLFGFNPDNVEKTPEEKAADAAALAKTKWTNAGYGDLYDKGKDWFSLDDSDNLLSLTDVGKAALSDYLLPSTGNEFNDYWVKWLQSPERNANVSDYDWLKGYTLYNGRLYKTDSGKDPNSALGKIYATSGFINKNKANQYGEAQKIINTFWGNPYEWNTADESMYSGFTWDPTANNGAGGYRMDRRFRNEAGRYSGIESNQQLVSYYDPDAERDYRGMWTDAGQRFAITDEWGDVVADGLTSADLEQRGIKKIIDSAGNEVPYDPNRKFHQRALYKSSDKRINNHTGIFYGENDQIGIYYNPMRTPNGSDPESHVLLTMPGLDAAYVVPATLAKKLLAKDANGVRGIEKIIADTRFQEILKNVLERIGQGKFWSGGDANRKKLAQVLGMNDAELQQFLAECDQMTNDEKVNRKTKWKVSVDAINAGSPNNQVQSQKQGGVIRKFAPGGGFAKASGSTASTSQTKTKVKDYRQSRTFNDGGGHLTSADIADLTGLGLDIAAIAAGSAPIAGGVLGLAGTGTGLYADIKRDGFQWSDLGSAALSGTMDIVSMLPGLGSGVQAAKVASKIAKFSKPAIKLLAAAGAVNAAAIVGKIANGEKPTIQEWRILANGFAAGINVAKLGGPGKSTKPGTFKDINVGSKTAVDNITIKPKTGEDLPEIKLTKDQLQELDAITDPVKKQDKFRAFAKTSLASDPRTKGQNVNSLLNKYDLTKSTTSVPTGASGEITLNTRNAGEGPEITLSKAEIDEINAQPTASAKMAKARETVAHKLWEKRGKPIGTPEVDEKNALKYNYRDLWSPRVKSGLAGRPDITLNDTDIKAISTKATPAEQEKAFVDIVKSKSGDDSLDSIDKIKEAFKVDDFFEKKRGNWEWKHPIESFKNLKKTDTFTLKAEKVEEPKPVRGNGKEGLFGFRDWWNNVGTYRGTNRSDLFNLRPETSSTTAPSTSPTSGTSGGTRTGINWGAGFKRIITPTPKNQRGILVMQPGNRSWFRIHNYTAEEAPGVIEDENDDTYGMTGAYTYKKGGLIPKARGGIKTEDYISRGDTMPQDWKEKLANFALSSLPTIGEFGSMTTAIKSNNKVRDTLNKALKNPPMMIAPQYNTPRFNDNGVLNEGRQLVKNIYDRQPANYTSDAMLNNFVRKVSQEKATEYENKINNAFSQQLAQHWAKMQEIQNKNLENQINTTNKNWKTIYANQNAIAKNNAATIISNWQSVDNFAKGRIKNLIQQLNNAQALKKQYAKIKRLRFLNNQPGYTTAVNEYNKYAAANPTGIDFNTWLLTSGQQYKPAYDIAVNQADLIFVNDLLDAENLGIYRPGVDNYLKNIRGTKVQSSKSGGKISKSNSSYKGYRDYKEQIAIDAHKEVRKAIAQLNKDCQQLLLRMLK